MSLNIWNNIDEVALYLGLERLDGEANSEFVNRIKQFSRWKYKTDYYTQAHSIPLQLGLKTEVIGRIFCNNKYECNIGWDYFTLKEILPDLSTGEYIRVFIENKDCQLSKIVNTINSSNSFTCDIYNTEDFNLNIDYLVRNNNIKLNNIVVNGKYSYLENKDIAPSSIRVDNPSYRNLVSSVTDLKRSGDYFIDYSLGFIQTFDPSPIETSIYYSYYDPTFALEKTELNLIPMNRLFAYGIADNSIEYLDKILDSLTAGE